MVTKDERVEKALDTLAAICDLSQEELENHSGYYEKRAAAEEILRHYRETEVFKNLVITLNVNGAIPVRPMTKFEMEKS